MRSRFLGGCAALVFLAMPASQPLVPQASAEVIKLRIDQQMQIAAGAVEMNGILVQLNGDVVFDDSSIEPAAGAGRGGRRAAPDRAGPHRLGFADGSRLHGTLESIDSVRQELIWRRPDASAPLVFPITHVSQLNVGTTAKQEVKVRATVKLTGGDWLAADLLGIADGKVQLTLEDGSPITIDRAHIEWIYLSKNAAPECYDGPTSLSGWISNGGWTFREGALRATMPSPIGRRFEALPDQVEYLFELDQGADHAFTIMLHGQNVTARSFGGGGIQLMFQRNNLRLWAQVGGKMKSEQVDLTNVLSAAGQPPQSAPRERRNPVRYRLLEDFPGGRLIVFIDGRKAAEWTIDKGKSGGNAGGFSFQPMTWSANAEQSISRMRVMPWDGRVPQGDPAEEESIDTDRVSVVAGPVKEGRLEGLIGEKLKLITPNGVIEIPRDKITLLRLSRPANPGDEDPPVVRVRLAQRGEFDAAGLSVRQNKLVLRTSFCGELTLATSSVREIEFLRSVATANKLRDLLVFNQGDVMPGSIESAGTGQRLRWLTSNTSPAVEVDTKHAAGVLLAPRAAATAIKAGMVARFRNGDLLSGDFLSLDKEKLVLAAAELGELTIPRTLLQALYFAPDGKLPVLDGAMDSQEWVNGVEFERMNQSPRRSKPGKSAETAGPGSPWRYFDGSFTLAPPGSAAGTSGNANPFLGRVFESMPQNVEFSFEVTSERNPLFFSVQLFSDPDHPGYMLQVHSQGLHVYDMAPRKRGAGMFQQQVQFGDKVKGNATSRRMRLLADRHSGKLIIMVDDVVVAQFGRKAGETSRRLGRSFTLSPQANMPCTFSNLWIGPWNGQVPGKLPASDQAVESVLLANGDEAQGVIENATPEVVNLNSEVGSIDLPMARLTMIDFGGPLPRRTPGARLRLVRGGALTVTSYRIEKETVLCQTELGGELRLPLSVVQEVVFAPDASPKLAEQTGTGVFNLP